MALRDNVCVAVLSCITVAKFSGSKSQVLMADDKFTVSVISLEDIPLVTVSVMLVKPAAKI